MLPLSQTHPVCLLPSQVGNASAVLGFVGAPFTMATYIVEGGSSKSFTVIKRMAFAAPEVRHCTTWYFTAMCIVHHWRALPRVGRLRTKDWVQRTMAGYKEPWLHAKNLVEITATVWHLVIWTFVSCVKSCDALLSFCCCPLPALPVPCRCFCALLTNLGRGILTYTRYPVSRFHLHTPFCLSSSTLPRAGAPRPPDEAGRGYGDVHSVPGRLRGPSGANLRLLGNQPLAPRYSFCHLPRTHRIPSDEP